jgi:hypothetical protein
MIGLGWLAAQPGRSTIAIFDPDGNALPEMTGAAAAARGESGSARMGLGGGGTEGAGAMALDSPFKGKSTVGPATRGISGTCRCPR